ncbi:MAG: DUF1993 domain-containing protein [Steroidobacteraceae bacterium]
MTSPIYTYSIPIYTRGLANLDDILVKAAAWTVSRKIDPSAILLARLAPDMFTFTKQVQIACDMVKNGCSRLAGIEAPKFEDKETSFDDLRTRIAMTVAHIETLKPEQFVEAATRDISFPVAGQTMNFKGDVYLATWVSPNFYFHCTMAYALLRHNGLELGKRDFLGAR